MESKFTDNPQRVLIINIIINLIVGSIKWFGGILGQSQALIADALETTSDLVSSIFVLVGYKKAIQPPDKQHPYGHGKLEAVTSLLIGLVLIFSACVIVYESINSLLMPDKSPPLKFTLIIVISVIIVKEVLFRVFRAISKKTNSTLFYNEALHHRTDAFTSFITLIGIGISLIPNGDFWFGDQIGAIVASGIILYNAHKIIRGSLAEIMDEQTFPEIALVIEDVASKIPDIDSYEKCYVRKSGNKFYADIHIRVQKNFTVEQGHNIAHLLKDNAQAQNPLIQDILVHVEPSVL